MGMRMQVRATRDAVGTAMNRSGEEAKSSDEYSYGEAWCER
jgi:hypothetical protein